MAEEGTMEKAETGNNAVRTLFAWTFAGIPLLAGVALTLLNATRLFQ
jgi:hypothetical protein